MNKEIKEILDYLKESATKKNLYFEINPEKAQILLDYITNLQESEAYYYGQYKDYKSRNEKAVEYIENDLKSFLYSIEYKTLLNILNGGDK